RRLQAKRHSPEVLLITPVPCYRPDTRLGALDHAGPSQRKSTQFDGNTARLAEQFVLIMHADDERIDAAQHGVHAVKPLDFFLSAFLLGDVLQRAEPTFRLGRSRLLLQRLDDLPDVHPRAVGPLQSVFGVDTGSLGARFDARAAKSLSIVWMEQVEPLTRTARHSR